ncbi:hypothetical protein GCM10007103_00060 [Salinimicrobium marinum]|uniref:Lipoprotein n=1 Tax=Salinimicrobium marinum TaxID=680283 RepID=A0A918VTM6_9FLAO|nr:hypothetical protein [Salinimicrobium marinum]GHA22989.1 hypothetical protein GCM10007103_00060 [Salinimicrobium marinum]
MELKKFSFLVIAGILLSSCCEEAIVASFKLNEAEKNLIPFTEFSRLRYEDQDGLQVVGLTQPRESKLSVESHGPESCDATEYEKVSNFIGFEDKDFVFQLTLEKWSDLLLFELYKGILDTPSREFFSLTCEGFSGFRKELFVDVSVGEFDFQNVLIFNDCTGISEVNRIIYSKEKGIEFIEYDNGNYLKLES